MAWSLLRRMIPFKPYRQEQGPPDLEDVFKKMWSGIKGKKTGDNNRTSQTPPTGGERQGRFGLGIIAAVIAAVIIVIWALSGIFLVQPAEQAVVLRFGKYVRTVNSGMHWIPRFIESKYVANVDQVNAINLDQVMLTSGENFVKVAFAVQYRIGDLKQFFFNVQDPVSSLRQIIDSAVRQVVGTSQLDNILTVGREEVSSDVLKQINNLVNKYVNGIIIVGVQMQPARPPAEVQNAFDDVIKAREDNQRLQSEAQGYANKVVPVAKGEANAMLQQAEAQSDKLVLLAQGDISLFNAILPKYQQAPKVTADRMYFDAMQNILAGSNLVMLDGADKGGNLTVLPLDQLLRRSAGEARSVSSDNTVGNIQQSNVREAQSADMTGSSLDSGQRQRLRFMEVQNHAS